MSITLDGTTYSLTHLRTCTHMKIPMEDWRGQVFYKPVMVLYSNHCYSTGEKIGIPFAPVPGSLIQDGSRRRQFDLARYTLSLMLPAVMEDLLHSPHAVAWDTGYDNRHYSQLICSPDMNAATPYYIFMRTSKEQIKDGPRLVKLVVESAYPIRPPGPFPVHKKPLTIRQWLGKTWENK
jgi:hypothetical protein